jgi:hypothetical protein
VKGFRLVYLLCWLAILAPLGLLATKANAQGGATPTPERASPPDEPAPILDPEPLLVTEQTDLELYLLGFMGIGSLAVLAVTVYFLGKSEPTGATAEVLRTMNASWQKTTETLLAAWEKRALETPNNIDNMVVAIARAVYEQFQEKFNESLAEAGASPPLAH